MPCELKVVDMV